MHNLAIALHKKGYDVSGSDDEIFEPSKSRLDKYGLLPSSTGWDESLITDDIDTIILGMHAREDNPELLKAQELQLKIYSYPEFLYEQSKHKTRVVIGGSHGKTTITSMILHVIKSAGIKFDYMVGSIIDGFETMVGFDKEAEYAIFEGDEYLTSTLDKRPKFHLYKPDIAVLSGIAWDHINVFPTFDNYVDQFRIFCQKIENNGSLIYYQDDPELEHLSKGLRKDIEKVPYTEHPYSLGEEGFSLRTNYGETPLKIFGDHNMQNINAAKEVCTRAGIPEQVFYNSIALFTGSAKRLQLIKENDDAALYLDFAHAPSKVKATVKALSQRYSDYKKICCVELHTFSSLSGKFLEEYRDSLELSDEGYVYYNPHALKLKRLESLSKEDIKASFARGLTEVFDDSDKLLSAIMKHKEKRIVYLFMSSGNFDNMDFKELAEQLPGLNKG